MATSGLPSSLSVRLEGVGKVWIVRILRHGGVEFNLWYAQGWSRRAESTDVVMTRPHVRFFYAGDKAALYDRMPTMRFTCCTALLSELQLTFN